MTRPQPARTPPPTVESPLQGDDLEALGRKCDFCEDVVPSVRRVALDHAYDRLQKAHQEKYACSECFEKKEQARMGLGPR